MDKSYHSVGRSPSGERGLKFNMIRNEASPEYRRSPSGERGLKYFRKRAGIAHFPGRSPSGERGLKYVMWCEAISALPVAPHPGSVD